MLLVISCDKDFQLCSEFIKKGFGKQPFSKILIKKFEKQNVFKVREFCINSGKY